MGRSGLTFPHGEPPHTTLTANGVAEPKPPYTMPVGKVVDFLKQAKIETLEMFDTYKEYLKHCITGPSSSDEEE